MNTVQLRCLGHSFAGLVRISSPVALLLLVVALSQGAFAATTTLTFDQFPDGTVLTTQYQNLGVTISGATVFATCSTCPFPPFSGTNVGYAPTGLMTLTFDSTVTGGSVQKVSAYVTDPSGPAGIFAYDSSNNLLGQAALPSTGGVNVLLSVTSTGNPIAYVNVHDGGGNFSIDNFSFTAPSSVPPPVSFQAAAPYPAGVSPFWVALADFNADGKSDLAVADGSSSNISVLLNAGNGTFGSAAPASIGTTNLVSYFVAAADVNGDGKPDLVVADENSTTIGVLLGNGDGTFQAVTLYPGFGNPISIAVNDFNGDGKLDLAVVNETAASVTILLGDGTGHFSTQVPPLTVGNAPNSVVAGDFNHDGKLDLAVVDTNDNDISILLGNGDGTFQPRLITGLTAGSGPFSIAAGDFNGDGKLDLAVANFFGNVSVLLGNGDGTFGAAVNYAVGTTPHSVAVGDLNGDGRLDLVVANNASNNVSVLLGNGDGSFMPAMNLNAGMTPTSVAIGDLNGDGVPDLAVSDGAGGVSILLNSTPTSGIGATTTAVTSSLNPSVFGQSVTLTATVTATSGTPMGTVTFNDRTTVLGTVAVGASGQAAFSTSSLTAGQHSMTATYMPTGSFGGSASTALLQTVNQATPVITWATPAAITYGTALSATQLNATANVAGTFTYSPIAGTVLGAGSATLMATFVPIDSTDYTNANASVTLTVNKASSAVSLTSTVNPSVYFQPVTFIANLTPQNGGAATGAVTFVDGAAVLATVAVNGNAASTTVTSFGAGTHSLSAVYSGDSNVTGNASTAVSQVVNKIPTVTALVSSMNPQQVNQPITFTAAVTGKFGGPSTGSMIFKDGAATLGTVAVSGNQASLTTSFATGGTRSITAQYSGDVNDLGSTSPALNQSVLAKFATMTSLASSVNPSFVGQSVTFTATVASANGTPPDGELIAFRRGGVAIGTAPLGSGSASFTTAALPPGTSNITARYPGDTTLNASTSAALTQVVNKYATFTSIASTLNPSTYGQSVTLTATVTSKGPAIPTGNVTFHNGASALGSVALDASGVATLTRSNLPAGTLSLTATYNGDSQSAKSSAPLAQTVNQVSSTTALTSSANPSTFGQLVTLRATVTTNTGITATGTVTFTSSTTTLGTVTLVGGRASFSTSTLPSGANSITATYSGTTNILGSSASVMQQVN